MDKDNYNVATSKFNELNILDFSRGTTLAKLTEEITVSGETFKPIDKFRNIQIVTQSGTGKVRVNATRINDVKAEDTSAFSLADMETVEKIVINGENVKILMKFNGENTWSSFDFASNTLIENVDLNDIETRGIPNEKFKDINFATIKETKNFTSLNFAYAFNSISRLESIFAYSKNWLVEYSVSDKDKEIYLEKGVLKLKAKTDLTGVKINILN